MSTDSSQTRSKTEYAKIETSLSKRLEKFSTLLEPMKVAIKTATDKRDFDEVDCLVAEIEDKWEELTYEYKRKIEPSVSEALETQCDKANAAMIRVCRLALALIDQVRQNTIASKDNKKETTTPKMNQNWALEPIKPGEFNGDITEWLPWWQRFSAMVHDRTELSRLDKMAYLHRYVTGTAKSAIAGLAITSENYGTAIKLL